MNKIELIKADYTDIPARFKYKYEFDSSQLLSSIDNWECFGIDYDSTKEVVIDMLINEFRMYLNKEVFGEFK